MSNSKDIRSTGKNNMGNQDWNVNVYISSSTLVVH